MYRKLLIVAVILLASIFSFNICFANNGLKDAADGVRNVVGDAENTVEDAAKDISNASKDATGSIENKANELGNDMKENGTEDKDNGSSLTNTMGITNGDYTASRTATTTDATFMGMTSNAWTWLILGIAAIAIIALVWYYASQFNSSNYNDKD